MLLGVGGYKNQTYYVRTLAADRGRLEVWRGIHGDAWRFRVWLDQPDGAVFVEAYQLEILGFVHFTRPHNLGVLDV